MSRLGAMWARFRRWPLWLQIIVGLMVASIALGPFFDSDDDEAKDQAKTDTTTSPTAHESPTTGGSPPPSTTAAAPTTTAPKVPSFKDGMHRVGADIQPGIYRLKAAGSGCYWARLRGFGGGVDDILANDNASGSVVVEIVGTDAGFDSTRCGTWRMDTSRITDSLIAFGEGTFITNTDFTPGQYRNNGGSGCYWARLRNFRGAGTNSIISNDNVDGQTIVAIAASDAGFTSTRCGEWTKIG